MSEFIVRNANGGNVGKLLLIVVTAMVTATITWGINTVMAVGSDRATIVMVAKEQGELRQSLEADRSLIRELEKSIIRSEAHFKNIDDKLDLLFDEQSAKRRGGKGGANN